LPGSFEHEEDDELSWKARAFLMPASKRQQRERRTACPAGDELEGNGLIFLIMVALESAASASVAQGKDQLAVRQGRWRRREQ